MNDQISRAACILTGGLVILAASIMLSAVVIVDNDVKELVIVLGVVAMVGGAALTALAVRNKLPLRKGDDETPTARSG